jgi:hypothetical protein
VEGDKRARKVEKDHKRRISKKKYLGVAPHSLSIMKYKKMIGYSGGRQESQKGRRRP